jgi:hypothetical protein
MKDVMEQSDTLSSGKEKSNAKTFRIPISNGIFEHYARLKDARWLLDLFVDWTTKEVPTPDGRRDGIVLGGKPIRDEDTASAFHGQCTDRTTRRWRQRLARFGYISQKRTPVGYVIRVKKSKKWGHLQASEGKSERPKMADHSASELPNVADLTARNARSELPNVADLTARNARSELPNVADPIKTGQGLYRDKSVSHDRTDGLQLTGLTWMELKITRLPVRFESFVELVEENPKDDDEEFVPWAQTILDLCAEREIEYPKVFLKRLKDAERDLDSQDDPYGEIARVKRFDPQEQLKELERRGLLR